ncbi:acetyl-CoA carboxylase biotin carboxylase subunit family protein, partial [Micromonospora zhanjiangensis]
LLQRRYLADVSPRSRLLAADRRIEAGTDWAHFPAVVKPVGREASSGVRRVADPAALRAALAGYDDTEPVLVEELVAGHEISVEALVQHGEVIFSAPTGKRTNESGGEFFVEMGHTAPDPELGPARTAAVLQVNREVLARLGFADGIAHAEYRITADGRPVLMEIAARAAGDSILELYHLATGAPMEEALLTVALGEPTSYPATRRYARQVYLPHPPGVLADVRADGLDAPVTWLAERWMWPPVQPRPADADASVQMVVAGRSVGAELTEIRQSGDRSTMFVIDAPSPAELDRLEARCVAAVTVEVRAELPTAVAA